LVPDVEGIAQVLKRLLASAAVRISRAGSQQRADLHQVSADRRAQGAPLAASGQPARPGRTRWVRSLAAASADGPASGSPCRAANAIIPFRTLRLRIAFSRASWWPYTRCGTLRGACQRPPNTPHNPRPRRTVKHEGTKRDAWVLSGNGSGSTAIH